MRISTEPSPNVSVRKPKHILPVRDALKQTLRPTGSSPNLPRPHSEQSTSNDLSFLSPRTAESTPPPITPPPPPPLHSPQPIYVTPSQLSHQSATHHCTSGSTANRFFSHPYFRTQFLQHLQFGSGRRLQQNSPATPTITVSSGGTGIDQTDRSNNSTMKSYLSSGGSIGGSTPMPNVTLNSCDINTNNLGNSSDHPNVSNTTGFRQSQRSSTGRSSSKGLFSGNGSQREGRRQRAMAAAAAAANRSFRRPPQNHPLHSSLRHSSKSQKKLGQNGSMQTPIPSDSMDAANITSTLSSPSPHLIDHLDPMRCSKYGCDCNSPTSCKTSEGQLRKPLVKPTRRRLTRDYWEQFLAQRIFLLINSFLFVMALITLIASCIFDPKPLHQLNSRGGFFAFNSCLALFLTLLGLYGVQRRQRRLLFAYAGCCCAFLMLRLALALAMLSALSQFSLQLISLMCIALIEVLLLLFAMHLVAILKLQKRPPLLPDQIDQSTTKGVSSVSPTSVNIVIQPQSELAESLQAIYNERPVDVLDQIQSHPTQQPIKSSLKKGEKISMITERSPNRGQDNPAFYSDSLNKTKASQDTTPKRGRNYSANLQQYGVSYDHLLSPIKQQKPQHKRTKSELPDLIKPKTLSPSKTVTATTSSGYVDQSPINWQRQPLVTQHPQVIQHLSSSAEPPVTSGRSRHGSGAMSTQSGSIEASPGIFRRETGRKSLGADSTRRVAAGSLARGETLQSKPTTADSGRGESGLSTPFDLSRPLANIFKSSLAASSSIPYADKKETEVTLSQASSSGPTSRSIFDYNYTLVNLSGLTSNIFGRQPALTPTKNEAKTAETAVSDQNQKRSTPRTTSNQRTPSVVYTELSYPSPSNRPILNSETQTTSGIATQSSSQQPQSDSVYNSSVKSSSRSQIQINRMNFLSSNHQSWANNNLSIVKSVLEEEKK